MLSGIRDILLVSSPDHIDLYKNLLVQERDMALKLLIKCRKKPAGIAEAFILGESFIEDKNVALILGDNIFYGYQFSKKLREVIKNNDGATIFAAYTDTPHQFGVVEFNKKMK